MFTPNDFDKENVDFTKERPYAGYMYLNGGYHLVKNNISDSYNFQIGFVGPSVKMDKVQKIIHDIIGSPKPKGWQNQIGDELIIQINYEKRKYQDLDKLFDYENNIVYYGGFNLGNASTNCSGGVFYRIGKNILKNFGTKRIDYRGYNNLPLKENDFKHYGFSINLWLEGDIVARNIFLDGNSFKDSANVDKEIFVLKGGYGFSWRYKNYGFDYIRTHSSKEFKTQNYYHSYGSFIFSYNF
jgi:hypothetical protein